MSSKPTSDNPQSGEHAASDAITNKTHGRAHLPHFVRVGTTASGPSRDTQEVIRLMKANGTYLENNR